MSNEFLLCTYAHVALSLMQGGRNTENKEAKYSMGKMVMSAREK